MVSLLPYSDRWISPGPGERWLPGHTRRLLMSLSLPRSSRFSLIMVVVLLVAGGIGAGVLFSHPSSADAAPSFAVAPYVDLTNSQEGMLDKAIKQAKLGAFTAAFVIGAGCTA